MHAHLAVLSSLWLSVLRGHVSMSSSGVIEATVGVQRSRHMGRLRILTTTHWRPVSTLRRVDLRLHCLRLSLGLGLCLRLGLCSLCLSLCGSLFAKGLCLLLLLSSGSWRPIKRARLEIHRRDKRSCVLLLRNEGM